MNTNRKLLLFGYLIVAFALSRYFEDNEDTLNCSLIFAFAILGFCYFRFWPSPMRRILLVAFALRLIAAIISLSGIFHLEGSTENALFFDWVARDFLEIGILNILADWQIYSERGYSLLLSLIYIFLGKALFSGIAVNIYAGTMTVLVVYKLSHEIWGRRTAIISAWVATLVPYLIIYSAVLMKESLIMLFFTLSCLNFERYFKRLQFKNVVLSFLFMGLTLLLHGGMIGGAFGIVLLSIVSITYNRFYSRNTIRIVFAVLMLSLVVYFVSKQEIRIYKLAFLYEDRDHVAKVLKTINSVREPDRLGNYGSHSADYSPVAVFTFFPSRFVHFFFEPFPWRIFSFRYPIYYTSMVFWSFIAVCLIFRGSLIIKRREVFLLFFLLIITSMPFMLGTQRISAATRHSTKIIPVTIALCGCYFEKIWDWLSKRKMT